MRCSVYHLPRQTAFLQRCQKKVESKKFVSVDLGDTSCSNWCVSIVVVWSASHFYYNGELFSCLLYSSLEAIFCHRQSRWLTLVTQSEQQCRSNSALFCMAINSQIKKPVQHPVRCWTTLICGWFSFSTEAYLAFGDHLTHVVPLQALSRTAPASTAGYFYPHLHSISFFRKLQPLFLKREFCILVAGNHNNVKSY